PDPDSYIPAFVRRYPFVFASDPKSDKLLLCVDTEAAMVSSQRTVATMKSTYQRRQKSGAAVNCRNGELLTRSPLRFSPRTSAPESWCWRRAPPGRSRRRRLASPGRP
ncbi:MAG: SapC family protein, partial [Bradyrhizobium icense]